MRNPTPNVIFGGEGAIRVKWVSVLSLLVFFAVQGCQNAMLSSAQKEAAAGRYQAAHEHYEAALTQSQQLSPRERQQASDGLCLTEYLIGAPTYSLSKQYHDCSAAAASNPKGESPRIAAELAARLRSEAEAQIQRSLERRDIKSAITQVLSYESIAGADRSKVAKWSEQIWQILERKEQRKTARPSKRLTSEIAKLAKENSKVRRLSRQNFAKWVKENARASRTDPEINPSLHGKVLNLWISESALPLSTTQLEHFAKINDAFAAWCGCDAKTTVSLAHSHLPAYLMRLDPDTGRSEVVVLVEK